MNLALSAAQKIAVAAALTAPAALASVVPFAPAHASSVRILHAFCRRGSPMSVPCPQGANPKTGLVGDGDGNLYGTAYDQGLPGCFDDFGCGTVFKLAPDRTFTVLYAFTGGGDGGLPWGTPIRDGGGNLYGTTLAGGAHNVGVIYKLAPDGTETVLHSFGGTSAGPVGSLLPDANGNFYGVTRGGNGSVYKLAPDGTFTTLHSFCNGCSNDGQNPNGDLVSDEQGNLYGTTQNGGTGGVNGAGVVFKIAPDGSETVLWNFCSQNLCVDGGTPYAGLIRDGAGNLYGTTTTWNEFGTVFKLAPDGTETTLHAFAANGDGFMPETRLVMGGDGTLYGTTLDSMFKIAPDGTFTVLVSGRDTYRSALIIDSQNNLFGTLPGTLSTRGNVFEITP